MWANFVSGKLLFVLFCIQVFNENNSFRAECFSVYY